MPPNLIWLGGQTMVAFRYAFDRAALDDGAPAFAFTYERLLKYPLRSFTRTLSVLIVPLIPFFLLFFRRDEAMPSGRFDRRFVAILAWGPFILTLLFSVISGGSINYSWVVPCFPLLGLFFVLWFKPYINAFSLRAFTGFILMLGVVFVTIFVVRSLWQQPYLKRGCDYENFPGKALAARLTAEWRRLYAVPLPFVIGDRRESCNIAVYSTDRPEAYFSANPNFSQWIDENEIREKGALILFDGRKKRRPKWLGRLAEGGLCDDARDPDRGRAGGPRLVPRARRRPEVGQLRLLLHPGRKRAPVRSRRVREAICRKPSGCGPSSSGGLISG